MQTKFLAFLFLLSIGYISNSQEKTYTQSELDSIAQEEQYKDIDTTSFKIIENVPIYKGCKNEKGNAAKKNCMSQKIAELFQKHFRTTLPLDSKVETGKVRIFVQFHIDVDGTVVDSTAKSADRYLENEALRVLQYIPKCTPGYQKGKPVKVPYALPLVVMVENTNDDKDFRYPVFRGCDEELSNAELKKCSKEKITTYIKMSYDLAIADAALPLEKSTQFQLEFIINKKGKVDQVNAKAHHRAVAIEAIRTAKRLPKFKKPGTRNGKPVETPYSLLMTIYF